MERVSIPVSYLRVKYCCPDFNLAIKAIIVVILIRVTICGVFFDRGMRLDLLHGGLRGRLRGRCSLPEQLLFHLLLEELLVKFELALLINLIINRVGCIGWLILNYKLLEVARRILLA